MRIGYGWDSHEFKAGVPLMIGGVRLKHPKGLAGHSDGDVLLHALTDAILGSVALHCAMHAPCPVLVVHAPAESPAPPPPQQPPVATMGTY